MPICEVPMPTEKKDEWELYGRGSMNKTGNGRGGFVLFELIIVIFIVAMSVGIAVLSFSGLAGRSRFEVEARQLASILRMAVTAAAESDRKYEVIIDIGQQSYTLREITSPDLSQVLEEEIIETRELGENCRLLYVQFDDMERSDEGTDDTAMFRAGQAGWQYGGKIVLLDSAGNEYSIVVNRLTRTIELEQGDVEFLVPRENVPF